jgi:hypothetical protein
LREILGLGASLSNMTGSDLRFLSFLTFCMRDTAQRSELKHAFGGKFSSARKPLYHLCEKADELVRTGHVVRLDRALLQEDDEYAQDCGSACVLHPTAHVV